MPIKKKRNTAYFDPVFTISVTSYEQEKKT